MVVVVSTRTEHTSDVGPSLALPHIDLKPSVGKIFQHKSGTQHQVLTKKRQSVTNCSLLQQSTAIKSSNAGAQTPRAEARSDNTMHISREHSRALGLVDRQQKVVIANPVPLRISICVHAALEQPIVAAIDTCRQTSVRSRHFQQTPALGERLTNI